MAKPKPPVPRPEPAGSVLPGEILSLAALKARFSWRDHAVRSARRNGLKFVRVGRQHFTTGAWILAFLDELDRQQNGSPDA